MENDELPLDLDLRPAPRARVTTTISLPEGAYRRLRDMACREASARGAIRPSMSKTIEKLVEAAQ